MRHDQGDRAGRVFRRDAGGSGAKVYLGPLNAQELLFRGLSSPVNDRYLPVTGKRNGAQRMPRPVSTNYHLLAAIHLVSVEVENAAVIAE